MIFVGADVHVRNTYFYATDFDGKRLAHERVANMADELREFCDRLLSEVGGELQSRRAGIRAGIHYQLAAGAAPAEASPGAPGLDPGFFPSVGRTDRQSARTPLDTGALCHGYGIGPGAGMAGTHGGLG